jgi:N-succinyldiaminopimelate aminotransferase
VVSPNPFYQIYEARRCWPAPSRLFLNQTAATRFRSRSRVADAGQWRRAQLVYVCSPGNPTGTCSIWTAGGRCSSTPTATASSSRPTSAIRRSIPTKRAAARRARGAHALGRDAFHNLVVFTSLSKRSNAPGCARAAVAGDAALLKQFLLYRTYHGCAMSLPVQHASVAAWGDESHVRDNRAQYRAKFDAVVPMLERVLDIRRPDASFYLWAGVPGGDDEAFTRGLFARAHVTVLPGRISRATRTARTRAPATSASRWCRESMTASRPRGAS